MHRETKELATSPFLLNHQPYVGISFQRIGKMEREIIASVITQCTPRQIFNPSDAISVVVAIQAASEQSMSDWFFLNDSYSAARPSGAATGDRSSARA